MKKIAILLAACSLVFTSCDLEMYPADQQVQDTALENFSDLLKFRNGVYSRFCGNFGTDLVVGADIQADYLNAVANFSNTYGSIHRWDYTTNDYDVYDVWENAYVAIANANFVLSKKATLSYEADEEASVNLVMGEMYFVRAMLHYILIDKFCGAYDAATATKTYSGIPVMLSYDPTAMPSRSTLAESYKAVTDDIAQAKTLLAGAAGAPGKQTITIDAVTALEARVALQMKDYTTAYTAATSLIDSETYALANTAEALQALFTTDTGSEVIFAPYSSTTELRGISGQYFIYDQNSANDYYKPEYVPTQAVLDMYADNDIRKGVYFLETKEGITEIAGNKISSSLYLLNKYPGNPNLQTVAGTKNYANVMKVFRIAEMYLIAAEAGVNGGGNDAKTYLNALREARGLEALASVAMADVKAERVREMILEGNRISDLKRWGDALMARTPQTATNADGSAAAVITTGSAYEQISINAGDFRFVWPIPEVEIFANQTLKDQQNPGWI